MEMESVYDEPDFDTSSLVHDDELQQKSYATKSAEKELNLVAGDRKGGKTAATSSRGKQPVNENRSDPDRQRQNQRHLQCSDNYYNSGPEADHTAAARNRGPLRAKINQSRHLPHWIWIIVTSVLGINKSFILAFYLSYALTILSALCFTVVGIIVVVYDIASKATTTTAHVGFISLLIGFAWICMGIYSFRLAGRLFGDTDFETSVRSHSRTLFKISSAALLILIGIGFTCLNLYSSFDTFTSDHCQTIKLNQMVCKTMYVSRAIFSVLAMLWNVMMGCMLLSVCRTHTIGIRRFIRDLDTDAGMFDLYWKEKLRRSDVGEFNQETASILHSDRWVNVVLDQTGIVGENGEASADNQSYQPNEVFAEIGNEVNLDSPTLRVKKESLRLSTELPEGPPIMSEEELLLCYWKISSRMRFTSQCLQRWLSSWIAFVVLWCADYVIYWLSHSPNILGIMEFLAPMLLLLVLCSAYAEVNGEGVNMIRCIVPTKERYHLLSFLLKQPLQMQVFNLSISYNAILTVLLAFSVAFASRLILDEVTKT